MSTKKTKAEKKGLLETKTKEVCDNQSIAEIDYEVLYKNSLDEIIELKKQLSYEIRINDYLTSRNLLQRIFNIKYT